MTAATQPYRNHAHLLSSAEVLDGIPTGLAFLDREGRLRYLNRSGFQLFGEQHTLSQAGAEHITYANLIAGCGGDSTAVEVAVDDLLHRRQSRVDLEQQLVLDGRQRWFVLTMAAYDSGDDTGLIIEHHDVSRQKENEALQAALYRIADLTSSAKDMDAFFAAIHAIIGELIYARNIYIALWDRQAGLLHFPYHIDEFDPRASSRPLKRGLTEHVLHSGDSLLVPPEVFEELVASGNIEKVGEPCVDWLGAPLKNSDTVFGMIALQSYTQNIRFSERDKELLTFVAQHLAVALARKQAAEALRQSRAQTAEAEAQAEAAQRHAQTMEMVHRLSESLSRLHDEQEILKLAAGELVRLFRADHSGIVLFADDGIWGTVVAEAPEQGAIGLRFAVSSDPLTCAMTTARRPVTVASIADDPRTVYCRDQLLALGYTSLMLVPLIVRDRVIGSIGLDSAGKMRQFNQEEQDLALTLANTIAVAIENARLHVASQQDLFERVRAEEERARLQEEIIQMQQTLLAELSTPLFPVSEQIVVMPIIGGLDSRRAQAVLEGLLQGVQQHRARVAILDITAVPVVDTQVANALLRAAQAVRLLGAQVILTGIRPEVAQALVGLGVDLTSILTRSSLQDGIAYALSGKS